MKLHLREKKADGKWTLTEKLVEVEKAPEGLKEDTNYTALIIGGVNNFAKGENDKNNARLELGDVKTLSANDKERNISLVISGVRAEVVAPEDANYSGFLNFGYSFLGKLSLKNGKTYVAHSERWDELTKAVVDTPFWPDLTSDFINPGNKLLGLNGFEEGFNYYNMALGAPENGGAGVPLKVTFKIIGAHANDKWTPEDKEANKYFADIVINKIEKADRLPSGGGNQTVEDEVDANYASGLFN